MSVSYFFEKCRVPVSVSVSVSVLHTRGTLFDKLSMQAWNEQPRAVTSKRGSECMTYLRKKRRRTRLPNTITIDSIYEKKFLSVNSIFEAVVLNAYLLPGD